MKQHKHKGVLNSSGGLRLHPVDRVHKDKYAKMCHNLALANEARAKKKPVKTKTKPKRTHTKSKIESLKKLFGKKPTKSEPSENAVMCQIDSEGYISMDLDKIPAKGVRFSFTRREGNHKKTVGLQIDNDPCKLGSGEFIKTHTGKMVIDRTVSF